MKPNEYSAERAKHLKRWKRNRDHTNGADAVKDAGTCYLPMTGNMDAEDYRAHKLSTEYFPAAARTLQSHTGLVFRKLYAFTAPPDIEAIANAITPDGKTLEQLARWAFREHAITNDGGLLVDHKETPIGTLTVAEAIARDIRPDVALYPAETILAITYGVIGGRKAITSVKLLDDAETVRQLDLVEGVYIVTFFKLSDAGDWVLDRQVTPLQRGNPLNAIPFIPLSDDDEGAAFDDLCNLNLCHYLNSADLSAAMRWVSKPVLVVTGLDNDVELKVENGVAWRFENKDTKVSFNEYKGDGVPLIERNLDRLEDHMGKLGSRLLTTEKAAAEAAETLARRMASENSILASMARHVSARIEAALKIVTEWMGLDASIVAFNLSTDFIPSPVDPQTIAQLVALNQAGKLTDRELFDALQRGEIIEEGVDFDAHQAELESRLIDPPLAG